MGTTIFGNTHLVNDPMKRNAIFSKDGFYKIIIKFQKSMEKFHPEIYRNNTFSNNCGLIL